MQGFFRFAVVDNDCDQEPSPFYAVHKSANIFDGTASHKFGFLFSRLKVALSFNRAALQLRLMWLTDRFSPPYSS